MEVGQVATPTEADQTKNVVQCWRRLPKEVWRDCPDYFQDDPQGGSCFHRVSVATACMSFHCLFS